MWLVAGCKQGTICYNDAIISQPAPIDITNMPDVVRIAEEVEATRTPRALKRKNKTVAVIMPMKKAPARPRQEKAKADYEAFKAAAGSWKDIDAERLLKDIYEDRRRTNTRPSVKL
jgi:hypothetical protein